MRACASVVATFCSRSGALFREAGYSRTRTFRARARVLLQKAIPPRCFFFLFSLSRPLIWALELDEYVPKRLLASCPAEGSNPYVHLLTQLSSTSKPTSSKTYGWEHESAGVISVNVFQRSFVSRILPFNCYHSYIIIASSSVYRYHARRSYLCSSTRGNWRAARGGAVARLRGDTFARGST